MSAGPSSDTPLADSLKAEIRAHGSITVQRFMDACLNDPQHGYYVRRPVLGAAGDFVTAPEISQVFGELLGLWSAVVWQQMGQPPVLNLVEFGAGRGTLMADALRAARSVPSFHAALRVTLVDTSPVLRELQQATLRRQPHVTVTDAWLDPAALQPGPLIVIANEFLDALPIEQFVFHDNAWHLRTVALDSSGNFAFATSPDVASIAPSIGITPTQGDIFERCGGLGDMATWLDQHVASGRDVAALFIDYGHTRSAYGDTLQGVKQHRQVSPFTTPGESDLTAQVDFAAAARSLTGPEFVAEPLTTQAEFLGALGIVERASKLMASNPRLAGSIEAAVARLMAPNGMGTRFKVLGLRSARLAPLPGFPG